MTVIEMYKILLIDDERILCLSMQVKVNQALKGIQLECRYALTGEQGIQESEAWQPDIAIVDFCLPDLVGSQIVRRIHEVSPDTLFIALSAFDRYEYVRSMFVEGSIDYLLKPVPMAELERSLKKAINVIDARKQLSLFNSRPELARMLCTAELMDKNSFVAALLQEESWHEFFPYSGYFAVRIANIRSSPVHRQEIHLVLDEAEDAVWQLLPCRNGDMIVILNSDRPEDHFAKLVKDFRVLVHEDYYMGASEASLIGIVGLYTALLHARKARIAHLVNAKSRTILYTPSFERNEQRPWAISELRLSTHQERKNALDRILELCEHTNDDSERIAALSPTEFEIMYLNVLSVINRCSLENGEDCAESLQPLLGFGTLEQVKDYFKKSILQIRNRESGRAESLAVQKAAAYIREHYAEPISVKMLADHCYMNYTYFSELFKKELGVNVTQYLTEIRMNHAAQLLQERSFSLEKVAQAVGYSNAKSFSQAFRNFFGVSPKKYSGMHHN